MIGTDSDRDRARSSTSLNGVPLDVLVVEDDADTCANLRDVLELDAHVVTTVQTAAAALAHPNLATTAVILLDRRLSDATAEEFLPRLRALATEADVIIITGYADVASAIAALRLGAYDYVLKPINPEALRASLRRISVRRQAELAAREGQERLRAILDAAVDAIITIDETGVIESLNPAALRLFGYAEEELVGRKIDCLMPPPFADQHDQYLARYLATGEARIIGIGREVLGRRKDGGTFPIDLSVSEVRLRDRRLFTGIIRDISARKQAEERLLESERLAAIGEAMAGLTHESRNALQRSQACLEMLSRRVLELPEAAELVRRIQQAQDDLHRLYEEVRGYAAPVRIQPEWCDLVDVLRETWEHLALKRYGREAELKPQLLTPHVRCQVDRFALRQVFNNILENALAACRDPVQINVTCQEIPWNGGPAIRIAIRDNGPGLNPEQRERIFDAFYTTKTHGTGLGMAISKRLIDAHGGEISLGPGPGAQIVITLPRQQSEGGP